MNVRYGIIGLGEISRHFASVLKKTEGVELTAVASRDQARSDAFAEEYGARKACATYLDVITSSDVDIVYIGLTHNFHFEMTKLCLEHHKAVLCEKPLVITQKEAEELVALAQKNQTLLMEALWTRCMPAFQKAREWVRAGRIGKVKLITANYCRKVEYDPESRLWDPKLAGGCLFDLGVYPLDFATGILDEIPTAITGLAQIAPNGVDESAAVSMHFASGALASINCSFTADAADNAVIYGTEGRLVLANCYGPQKCERFDSDNKLIDVFEESVESGFTYQILHCAELFRSGKIESSLIPWRDTTACAGFFDTLRRQWGLI